MIFTPPSLLLHVPSDKRRRAGETNGTMARGRCASAIVSTRRRKREYEEEEDEYWLKGEERGMSGGKEGGRSGRGRAAVGKMREKKMKG